jgi:hypothetical protein
MGDMLDQGKEKATRVAEARIPGLQKSGGECRNVVECPPHGLLRGVQGRKVVWKSGSW